MTPDYIGSLPSENLPQVWSEGAVTAEAGSERWNLAGCEDCGGAMSQGTWAPLGAGKGQETDSCLDLPKEHTAADPSSSAQ